MKKLFLLLGIAAMAVACHKPIVPELTINSEKAVTVASEGETVSVQITTNVAWTASLSNSSWASVMPASGEAGTVTIKVSVMKNDDPDPRSLDLTITALGEEETKTDKVVINQLQKNALVAPGDAIEISCDEQDVKIALKANVDYDITPSVDWIKVVKTKGLSDYTAVVHVALNKADKARTGSVQIKGDGVNAEVTIKQAAFVPVFEISGVDENGYLYVGQQGGEASFTINANVDYTIKKYDGADEAFPWAPVTIDGGKVTFKAEANKTYGSRSAYVKITSPDIQVPSVDEAGEPTGETEDLVVRIYLIQEGLEYLKYSLSMYDMEFDTWGTTVLSEAIYNGFHYVSNGQDLYKIDPATGSYIKISWFCGLGMTQKVITNDEAGNFIVCNHTAYVDDAYTDGYFILNVITPEGFEENVITKAAWECGGPFGSRINVKGNILKDAIIVAPVEGISGITMSNTIGYWEVVNGIASEYKTVTVSGIDGTWACACWNTYPNNFPTIISKGLKGADGFVMTGCYEDNKYYNIAADGAATPILLPDPVQDGNYAYQSMDIKKFGDKTYLVSLASTHFPSWGLTPYISLIDVDNFTPGGIIHEVAVFDMAGASYFAPDWDWAISVAADVKLYDAADGKVGIAFTDLNARSVEAFEINPAI